MEHRWGSRKEVSLPVEMRRPGMEPLRARIEDLSLSGAKLRLPAPLPTLARWDVRIGEHVVPAWVVRRTANGVGLEWCEFAPAVIATILRAPTGMRRRPIAGPATMSTERTA
ncbi:MAG: PilZ domain-containing protein [Gammaproteobacteria bacterium]|nr:PilZ domain-containing protein [Gammaproteobacteria bacterium]